MCVPCFQQAEISWQIYNVEMTFQWFYQSNLNKLLKGSDALIENSVQIPSFAAVITKKKSAFFGEHFKFKYWPFGYTKLNIHR